MNKYTFIFVFWIFIFGLIVYKRSKSDTVILLAGIMITYVIYKKPSIIKENTFDKDIQSWIDNLTTTKDVQEIDRSYNIISNYIYSKSLANDNIEYSKLLSIIEKYKPNIPLPVNIDNNSQYDISVGFTNNKTV
tara:strand:+ start:1033 stop:1434 length:402 start_codon:yes stop_codon:yes gene_type:complete